MTLLVVFKSSSLCSYANIKQSIPHNFLFGAILHWYVLIASILRWEQSMIFVIQDRFKLGFALWYCFVFMFFEILFLSHGEPFYNCFISFFKKLYMKYNGCNIIAFGRCTKHCEKKGSRLHCKNITSNSKLSIFI